MQGKPVTPPPNQASFSPTTATAIKSWLCHWPRNCQVSPPDTEKATRKQCSERALERWHHRVPSRRRHSPSLSTKQAAHSDERQQEDKHRPTARRPLTWSCSHNRCRRRLRPHSRLARSSTRW